MESSKSLGSQGHTGQMHLWVAVLARKNPGGWRLSASKDWEFTSENGDFTGKKWGFLGI
jgi:hypothetical protein